MKIISKIIVTIVRLFFRLPNRVCAYLLSRLIRRAEKMKAPRNAISDITDARDAMKKGPPLSETLRKFILKSDPDLMADLIYNQIKGDQPIGEIDPW